MKYVFTIVALLTYYGASAQVTNSSTDTSKTNNCKYWIETFEDKASGKMVTGALENAVGTTTDGKTDVADVYVMRSPGGQPKDIAITISILDGGCIPHLGDVTVYFVDESKTIIKHDGKPNCTGFVECFMGPSFLINDASLKMLNNKTVKFIQVVFMNDKWVDMQFTETEANKIMYAIRCLSK